MPCKCSTPPATRPTQKKSYLIVGAVKSFPLPIKAGNHVVARFVTEENSTNRVLKLQASGGEWFLVSISTNPEFRFKPIKISAPQTWREHDQVYDVRGFCAVTGIVYMAICNEF